VLGIGGEVYEQQLPAVHDSLHANYQAEDMHDDGALVRARGYFTPPIGK
jgi:hypothetical protein